MATSHSDTAFLTLTKSFTYRGAREQFSNVYHLDQIPPASSDWLELMGKVWNFEKQGFPVDVQLEVATGHNPGTPPVLVWEYDSPPVGQGGEAGTYVPGGAEHRESGDVAAWIRYGTTQKTKLGKPIYLRNYYHAVYSWADVDGWSSNQLAKFDALGTAFVNGIVGASATYRRAGPRGAVAQNHQAGQWLTTRTLKRRGRRHKKIPSGATVQLPPIMIN